MIGVVALWVSHKLAVTATWCAGASGQGPSNLSLPGAAQQRPASGKIGMHPTMQSAADEPAPVRSASTSSSSSANSTLVKHLIDLKEQAGMGRRQVVDPHDVQDVENMLEAYSLQV